MVTRCLLCLYLGLTVGFAGGYYFHQQQIRFENKHHQAVCESNQKYQGHMAYDTNGDRMCFQQSKLSGRIERVSLAVRGL